MRGDTRIACEGYIRRGATVTKETRTKTTKNGNGCGNAVVLLQQCLPCTIQNASHVFCGGEISQKGDQIGQLCVMRVVEPGGDRHGIVRVKYI